MKSLMRANQVGLKLWCTGRYKIWISVDHINYLIKFLKMMEGGSGSLQTSRVTSNRCVNKGPTNLFLANVTTAPSVTAIRDSAQASLFLLGVRKREQKKE